MKKEYLSSLQPRLNSIMQVWSSAGGSRPAAAVCSLVGLERAELPPASLAMRQLLRSCGWRSPEMSLPLGSQAQLQPLLVAWGGRNRRRNWVSFRSKSFPGCQPLPQGLTAPEPALSPAPALPCCLPALTSQLGGKQGARGGSCCVSSDEGSLSSSPRPLCLSRSISSCPLTRPTSSTRPPGTCRLLSTFSLSKPVPMARPAVSTEAARAAGARWHSEHSSGDTRGGPCPASCSAGRFC